MTLAALVLFGGLTICGLILYARWVEARAWRASLSALRITLPAALTADEVAAWLAGIAASTLAPRWTLLPYPPIALEIVADQHGIQHYLLIPAKMRPTILSGLRAALPGARLEAAPDYLGNRRLCQLAAEARLTSHRRPLAVDRAAAASTGLLAALQPLARNQRLVLQWILIGAGTPAPVRQPPTPQRKAAWRSWQAGQEPYDHDGLRQTRLKQRQPLLYGVLRLGVLAAERDQRYALFGRTWGTLRSLNAVGVSVVRRWWLWPQWVAHRLHQLSVPVTRWPLLVNSAELVGLLGFPLGGAPLPGLPRAVARHLPPPVGMPAAGAVLAMSTYPGMTGRPLALKTSDRLRHSWVIGPTGAGKSTLLCGLITQDIAAGRGVAVLDPKGDLITDVLDRVPSARRNDVLVIDPSATDSPVGLNLLDIGQGEHARELAVDHLTYVMSSLWRSSWGPRTSDVIRSALLTLTHTTAADGSRFTLVELPELLLNAAFRAFVTRQPTVPETVRSFWIGYEAMKDGERAQVIGPTLNKLRQFTTRTALRLMLGQSRGVRLDEVFTRRRIILVSLAKGALGTETTALIGSLVMAGLWQATLSRINVPQKRRHPVFLYIDEFQDILRLPIDLADMLAQARGLGVGLVLAHQYLGQLTNDVKTAVLGTARTQVVFQTEYDDAHTLAQRFAPLTHQDLSGLAAYEIAIRPCVDGTTLGPVTGRTQPLPEPTTDGRALAAASHQRYGRPRREVEAALRERINQLGGAGPRLGRQRSGGRP